MWKFISDHKSHNFFRFWFAQLITQFGDRFFQMALVAVVTALHPGSAVQMSYMFFFAIIPAFIIGPVAGVFIDRWDRRTSLFICYFLQCILVLFAAFYLARLPYLWPMYVVVFIIASLSRFYVPAKLSIIPEIVQEDDILVANSLANITGQIAGGLGMLLGSWIVESTGSFGGFTWDAGCYFLSAAFVFSITVLHRKLPNKQSIIAGTRGIIQAEKTIFHEIAEGIHYIRTHKEIRFILRMMFILIAAVGGVYVVGIIFIQQAFHSVTKDLGFLAVTLGVGSVLGSLAYGTWGKKISAAHIIFWSLILGGAMVVFFVCTVEATHNRFIAGGLSFLLGFIVGPVMVAPYAIINKVCAKEMSGKVFAAMEFVVYLAFLVAMLISSFLSTHIPGLWIIITVGGIFMVVGLVGLIRGEL